MELAGILEPAAPLGLAEWPLWGFSLSCTLPYTRRRTYYCIHKAIAAFGHWRTLPIAGARTRTTLCFASAHYRHLVDIPAQAAGAGAARRNRTGQRRRYPPAFFPMCRMCPSVRAAKRAFRFVTHIRRRSRPCPDGRWWTRTDSNREPAAYEAAALPLRHTSMG